MKPIRFNCAMLESMHLNRGVGRGMFLPVDPDASARGIVSAIRKRLGITAPVVISDTFGRPWRNGAFNVAIGVAGLNPMLSYVGEEDSFGNIMYTTTIAVADEIAAAAELVTGKVLEIPVALIKGYGYEPMDDASHDSLIRSPDKDLFREFDGPVILISE
ncbi:MAG: hypothetical protein Ct9H300mP27_11920 [Chloroflexota bacterium]|nr:MAG: hypothetical protein Ct9H300mP27_11920 [Chloroflexota bacterium]